MEAVIAIIVVLRINHAIMAIVQLIVVWATGAFGAGAPPTAVLVLNPVLAVLLLRVLMGAVNATRLLILEVAILNPALWIALWVNGLIGLTARRAAVVVPDITLVQSLLVPVMVAKLVLQPVKVKIAILSIVQLMVLWVNGVVGARAQRNVVLALNLALALRLPHDMEVVSATEVLTLANATLTIAQSIAVQANGVFGARVLRPVALAIKIALAR